MVLNFCTLFNSSYLSRGLALYDSLVKHCPQFHLYIFAFDEVSYRFIQSQNYPHITVISLKEFEDPELLNIKPTRSAGEYCWTCTASTIKYSIEKFGLTQCTYIDADMLFYSNPQVLIDEMGDKSVLITEHRYTSDYDQSLESGKYCVQFVTFKNTPEGMQVLNDWRKDTIDWCYDRVEDGKFGDQKYLDYWITRYNCIHELKYLGGGIAPWNVQQYSFQNQNGKLIGKEITSNKTFDVVFFHYHSLKFYQDNIVSLCASSYMIHSQIIQLFYKPYVRLLNSKKQEVNRNDVSFNPHGNAGAAPLKPMSLATLFNMYRQNIAVSRRNVLGFGLLKRIQHHYFYDSTRF
jgi:hypothetical protein